MKLADLEGISNVVPVDSGWQAVSEVPLSTGNDEENEVSDRVRRRVTTCDEFKNGEHILLVDRQGARQRFN